MRSPIRPPRPNEEPTASASKESTLFEEFKRGEALPMPSVENPQVALNEIRQKMEQVAAEFAAGKINRMQFNAIYGRYNEQRAIIQRLIERDPNNNAWKQVAAPGHTGFLRTHFEARPIYYVIFQHNQPRPLLYDGTFKPKGETLVQVLRALWKMQNRPAQGLARRQLEENRWLVVAFGQQTVTLVIFTLEPSAAQAVLVRDLHMDFERANELIFKRGTVSPQRMVFPQRALLES